MKQISVGQLAMSFTGVFLGAGFVSGQELWQFFACFGPLGMLGFLGSAAIFFLIIYASLQLVRSTGQEDVTWLMTLGDKPRLRLLVSILQTVLLFGVMVIMIAGASALVKQLLGIPAPVVGVLFIVIVGLVALMGMQGMVATFSLLVPITTACAVVLGVTTLIQTGLHFPEPSGSVSVMLPNWVVGFFTYAAYNLFGTICVLAPMAKLLPKPGMIRQGLGLGSLLLVVLAWSMIAAMLVRPETGLSELPMAELAGSYHSGLAVSYGILMGLGMFSATLSSMIALIEQLELRLPAVKQHHKGVSLGLLVTAYLGSLLGFGSLIGVVYPFFGYASIPFLLCILVNWKRSWKNKSVMQ